MTIYRNKENQKLYLIENVIDTFPTMGGQKGYWAIPYNHQGERIFVGDREKDIDIKFESVAYK